MEEYKRWRGLADDPEILAELSEMERDCEKIKDAFFRELEFGTGGLRGVIGAGTNRMNIYTVRRATLGLCEYLFHKNAAPRVAIGYDTRIKSELFAKTAACALASRGATAYLYRAPLPTPTLSYAVRELSCDAGIMITASHNPKEYNGYKVYGSDGCQITDDTARAIYGEISKKDYFDSVATDFDTFIAGGRIEYIDDDMLDSYLRAVSENSVLFGEEIDKCVSVVYTALNGTGYVPVTRILSQNGYKCVTVVKEQAEPDGNFPTCPYPNPEIRDALTLGLQYAAKKGADILIATDPDCDRVGVAAIDGEDYRILSGNEVGVLLFDYIINQRKKHGRLVKNPIALKTVVTTELAKRIADSHGIEMLSLLTGFKYIGEQIGRLEVSGEVERFIFGFEESCGYLPGTYVRDKDGVVASLLVAEMTAYYKMKGIALAERLREIYELYGYSKTKLDSYSFPGEEGFRKMKDIMSRFREGGDILRRFSPIRCVDFLTATSDLPKSDVIKFELEGATVTLRPSGTEPKLKIYIEAFGESESCALSIAEELSATFARLINA